MMGKTIHDRKIIRAKQDSIENYDSQEFMRESLSNQKMV